MLGEPDGGGREGVPLPTSPRILAGSSEKPAASLPQVHGLGGVWGQTCVTCMRLKVVGAQVPSLFLLRQFHLWEGGRGRRAPASFYTCSSHPIDQSCITGQHEVAKASGNLYSRC